MSTRAQPLRSGRRGGKNPRGEPTWPEWRKAKPDVTRVEHVRSGRRGTFVRWPKSQLKRSPGYAVIRWDPVVPDSESFLGQPFTGRVVAYAFDLKQVS